MITAPPTRRPPLRRSITHVVITLAALATLAPPVPPAAADQSPRARRAPTTFAVGRVSLTFVDESRPTDANNSYPGAPDRTIPVMVLYPAKGTPGGPVTDDARPSKRHGPYPLFEFSHGFTANGPAYEQALLAQIASHGYVVAAPTFPLSNGNAPGGPKLGDYVNQPADVSFVITRLLRANRPHGRLAGLIDQRTIGAGGHSLGAITTFGVTANSCCIDRRIDAAVPISGLELPFGDGTWSYPTVPRLLIHGDQDRIVPYFGSTSGFAHAGAPKFLLTLLNAPHTPFVAAWKDPIIDTTVAFLDRYLKHQRGSLTRMTVAGNVAGIATLEAVPPRGA